MRIYVLNLKSDVPNYGHDSEIKAFYNYEDALKEGKKWIDDVKKDNPNYEGCNEILNEESYTSPYDYFVDCGDNGFYSFSIYNPEVK